MTYGGYETKLMCKLVMSILDSARLNPQDGGIWSMQPLKMKMEPSSSLLKKSVKVDQSDGAVDDLGERWTWSHVSGARWWCGWLAIKVWLIFSFGTIILEGCVVFIGYSICFRKRSLFWETYEMQWVCVRVNACIRARSRVWIKLCLFFMYYVLEYGKSNFLYRILEYVYIFQ